jgi:hypothetical protein
MLDGIAVEGIPNLKRKPSADDHNQERKRVYRAEAFLTFDNQIQRLVPFTVVIVMILIKGLKFRKSSTSSIFDKFLTQWTQIFL